MKLLRVLLLFFVFFEISAQNYLFFLHNRFVELYGPQGVHDQYGKVEYYEILNKFRAEGFTVISELRPPEADGQFYSNKVCRQIDSLINKGVDPSHITVLGTSKGGYIAMMVCRQLRNKHLNFVFVASCASDMDGRDIYGNILSIYDRDDELGRSCLKIKEVSGKNVNHFSEIELNLGLNHGFLFKALPEWVQPTLRWANGDFEPPVYAKAIDSLLSKGGGRPFNGVIMISEKGKVRYQYAAGFSDFAAKKPLLMDEGFVIGSISKQITAVLVLKEVERGRLKLSDPIGLYLPGLNPAWADSVTVHHLLAHVHGITALDKPLLFRPGTAYDYSQLGYELLSRIVEKTSGKTFAELSTKLFEQCDMQNTAHPAINKKGLIKSYTGEADGTLKLEDRSLENYVAAGGFISTANDLLKWNAALFGNKLLRPAIFKLMMTKQKNAVRQHPLYGATAYGYGITVSREEGLFQLGQTGFAPGFVSMDFYFPESETSLVILENVVNDPNDLKKSFFYHTGVQNTLRASLLEKKVQAVKAGR